MSEILRVEHLSKSFEGLVVLDDISFSVNKGETVVIVGLRKEHTASLPERTRKGR